MEKIEKKEILKDIILEKGLENLLKEDMFFILDIFDKKVKKNSTKKILVEEIKNAYVEKLEKFIDIFSVKTNSFFRKGDENIVSDEQSSDDLKAYIEISNFGLGELNKERTLYKISSSFFKNYLNLIESEEFKNKVNKSEEIEVILSGIVRYYGVISEEKSYEIIKNMVSDVTFEEIKEMLRVKIEFTSNFELIGIQGTNQSYVISDKVFSPDETLAGVLKRPNIEYKILAKEEYINYSNEAYYKTSPLLEELELNLSSYIANEKDRKERINNMIDYVKNQLPINFIIEELMKGINFEKIEEAKYYSESLKKIWNEEANYILKGNSHGEVGGTITSNKIPVNSKCLCGSGKKYKKCCGK